MKAERESDWQLRRELPIREHRTGIYCLNEYKRPRRKVRRGPLRLRYGVVVASVNVSVFEYAPVRSASLAPIACWKAMATVSLDFGLL
jgi:hypothetical protein